MYRNSWIEIDVDALRDNVKTLKAQTQKKFIAVIKANGYGNGDVAIAKVCVESGADMLAVSSLDEALSIRHAGIDAELLILGYVDPMHLGVCVKENITVTAVSLDWVKMALQQECSGLKVHLKVDTGMNRIGFKDVQELKCGIELLKKGHVQMSGIFTHFACSDDAGHQMTDRQMKLFEEIVTSLNREFEWIHCSNSDATVSYKESFSNAVRCGLAMFGTTSYPTELKPVMSLYTKIIHVKKVPAGQTVGYGATYTTKEDEIIATVPIGYADGWVRNHQGRKAYVNGHEAEFVGRICMDQAMLRLKHWEDVGTLVELIGDHISLGRVAQELQTIPYEVMTLLSDRLTKVYKRSGSYSDAFTPRFEKVEELDV